MPKHYVKTWRFYSEQNTASVSKDRAAFSSRISKWWHILVTGIVILTVFSRGEQSVQAPSQTAPVESREALVTMSSNVKYVIITDDLKAARRIWNLRKNFLPGGLSGIIEWPIEWLWNQAECIYGPLQEPKSVSFLGYGSEWWDKRITLLGQEKKSRCLHRVFIFIFIFGYRLTCSWIYVPGAMAEIDFIRNQKQK